MSNHSQHAVWDILRPRSVAVIGASERPGSMADAPIANLLAHGWDGTIYPVNPNRSQVYGIAAYPDVAALPETPDTAVIAVPAGAVVDVLEQCDAAGIRSATVLASGFGEGAAGDSGTDANEPFLDVLQRTDVRVLGPNTAGVVNVVDGYVPRGARNHPVLLPKGGVAIVTQSGAVSNTVMCRCTVGGVGLSYVVASGNQSDLTAWEIVTELVEDERTTAVLVAVEAAPDPDEVARAAAAARAARKPIVVLQLGRSSAGVAMASTHSGSLAAPSRLLAGFYGYLGIMVVPNTDALVDLAKLIDSWGAPDARWVTHGGVGIVSTSGGEAIQAVDHASEIGVQIPPLSHETTADLDEMFRFAAPANPLDLTGQFIAEPDLLARSLARMARDPGLAALVVIATIGGSPIARATHAATKEAVDAGTLDGALVAWVARVLGTETPETDELLRSLPVPLFESPESALDAVARYRQLARLAQLTETSTDTAGRVRENGRTGVADSSTRADAVPYWPSRRWFQEQTGATFPSGVLIGDAAEAETAAAALRPPFVIKASSEDVVHKRSAGYVNIGSITAADAADVVEDFLSRLWPDGPPADGCGVVVEEFSYASLELFLGGVTDPRYGKFLLFGSGGRYVEESARVIAVPCGDAGRVWELLQLGSDALHLVSSEHPAALAALREVVGACHRMFQAADEVEGFDLNPLVVTHDDQVLALDARLSLCSKQQAS